MCLGFSQRGTRYRWARHKHSFETNESTMFLETEAALPYCNCSIKMARIIWFGSRSFDIGPADLINWKRLGCLPFWVYAKFENWRNFSLTTSQTPKFILKADLKWECPMDIVHISILIFLWKFWSSSKNVQKWISHRIFKKWFGIVPPEGDVWHLKNNFKKGLYRSNEQ